MCLAVVTETFNGADKAIDTGFKRFRYDWEGVLRLPMFMTHKVIKKGIWLTASKGNIPYNIKGIRKSYPKGFHLFKTKAGADDYASGNITLKIFYRGVVAFGRQHRYGAFGRQHRYGSPYKAVVARAIFIPDEQHPEPPEYTAQKKRAAKKRAAAKSRKSTNRQPARASRNKRRV